MPLNWNGVHIPSKADKTTEILRLKEIGGEDYHVDFLFYHRTLCCLVTMELKTEKVKPKYISKMDFYLEGLDR